MHWSQVYKKQKYQSIDKSTNTSKKDNLVAAPNVKHLTTGGFNLQFRLNI